MLWRRVGSLVVGRVPVTALVSYYRVLRTSKQAQGPGRSIDTRKVLLIAAACSLLGVKNPTVLDLGCGDCRYASVVEAACGLGMYVGVDAKPNCQGRNVVRTDLEVWDSPFVGVFDLVLALDILEHLTNYGHALDVARKAIKPSGLLLVSTIAVPMDDVQDAIERDPEHVHLYTRELLKRALRRHGFEATHAWQDHEILLTIAKPI